MDKLIEELISNETGICISLIIPTGYNSFTEKEKVSILIKKNVHYIEKKLKENYEKEVYKPLINELHTLIDKFELNHPPKGLGIYISEKFSKLYHFHFPIKEKAIVSDTFEIQDIIYDLKKMIDFYVVILNKEQTKFYKGCGQDLIEIINDKFPKSYEYKKKEITNRSPLFKSVPQIEEKYLKAFFKEVSGDIYPYLNSDKFPLILIGPDKYIGLIKGCLKKDITILNEIKQNITTDKTLEILELIWPLIDRYQKENEKKFINLIENSKLDKNITFGIKNVFQKISDAKINMHLIAEKDYEVDGFIELNTGKIFLEKPLEGNFKRVPNIVEHLIEKVFRRNDGRIDLVNKDLLKKYDSIVLISDN